MRSLLVVMLSVSVALVAGCYMPPPTAASGTVVVRYGPPPPRVEVIGVAPAPGYVWIGGYWVWRERWHWHPGHWQKPPHHNSRWVRGNWRQRRDGNWVWHPGYWHR